MKSTISTVFLTLFLVLSVVAEKSKIFSLLAQNIETKQITAIGKLEYSSVDSSVTAVDVPEQFDVAEGGYCLGAEIRGAFRCYTYVDQLTIPLSYTVKLLTKPNGGLVALSYLESSTPGIAVQAQHVSAGPEPYIKKTNKEAGPAGQPSTDEEEEEKSFIQKYWMYIVPFLLIAFMAPGEEGQGAPAGK